MAPAAEIALLWAGFAATHMGLSSLPVRRRLVGALGEWPFRGLYSLVALAFFVPLVRVYFAHKHAGPWLWDLPRGPALRAVVYAGMGLAFVLAVASQLRPSPAAVVPGDPTPRGVYRITRHPLLMGLAVFGLVHLLPNGSLADVAFFGGFVAFSLVGAWHQDARKLALDVPGFPAFVAETPFLPFTGRETGRGLRELSLLALLLGLAAAVTVRWFHTRWFGG
ncbi:MAG TPA: NnrU family protein [Candidatus Binatia bacterium]|nr:NnrU family protein [Candidatus Binatia bacterium]